MKRINKLGTILTGILEVFHWVGAALMAAATVCSVAAPQWIGYFVSFDAKACCGAELAVYGFEVNAAVADGKVAMTTFFLFGIGAVIILAVMALVFRNLHLIFKESQNASPFQKDNICRCKTIGFLSIAVPVIGFVMSVITRLVIGAEAAQIRVSQSGIFMGIIVLCLTQFFIHGAALENDVDGLL